MSPLLHLMGSAQSGGAETYFDDLIEALARAGQEQSAAIHPDAAREARLAALRVPVRTFGFNRFDLVTQFGVRQFAKACGAGVCLAWMSRAAGLNASGPWANVGRLGGYYNLRFFRRCSHLVVNTPDLADYVVREGWRADRVEVIRNFAHARAGEAAAREAYDTPPDHPLVLSLGRLHTEKGHAVLLRAMVSTPDAWLWLAGAGREEARLRALAAELGIADRVRFLGWVENPAPLYRAADLCVFPSLEEPFGNVVIQCWVYGLPVIATSTVGPRAIVRDGEDGLLVPPGDVDGLAQAMRRLASDPSERRALAAQGARRALSEFGEEAVVAHWRAYLPRVEAERAL